MEPKKKHSISNIAKGLVVIVLFLIIWEVAAIIINNNYILPRLGDILLVLAHPFASVLGGSSLAQNALVSLREVLTGFLCAVAVAVPLGLLIGTSKEVDSYLNYFTQMIRPVPPIAWMPFAIAWFGLGFTSIIFIIFMGAFFPILINTIDGVHGVRSQWTDVARMFRSTSFERVRTVIVPGALPVIWTGLRVAFAVAWMCVVAAEMLPGTSAGLGFMIMYAYNLGQLQVIGAGMVIIGIIGLGADMLFRAGQTKFFHWQGRG
ncbi:MAG: ABC transporter permease [Methanomicrobiales archaeon]